MAVLQPVLGWIITGIQPAAEGCMKIFGPTADFRMDSGEIPRLSFSACRTAQHNHRLMLE